MENCQEKIIGFLEGEIPGIKGIYLFGSQADGTFREDSDYDIAFLTDQPGRVSTLEVFERSIELSDILEKKVDLIDLYTVPVDLKFEVVVNGKRIYYNDVDFCDLYETAVISMYQRFELERRDLVKAYKERIIANG